MSTTAIINHMMFRVVVILNSDISKIINAIDVNTMMFITYSTCHNEYDVIGLLSLTKSTSKSAKL
jgi:hypothetical protein